MAKKQGEERANVLPAESITNTNLQGQGTTAMNADTQQILITADYLRGEVEKATESMVERSVERSVQKEKHRVLWFSSTLLSCDRK